MKNHFLLICAIVILGIISCKKSDTPAPASGALGLLQNKWILDSLVIFQYPDFTGQRISQIVSGYEDFRIDKKRYGFSVIPGIASSASYDTSVYALADAKTLLDFGINNSSLNPIPDTIAIINLTSTALELSPVDHSQNAEYGKLFLHR